jgi:hypothetical protein
LPRKLDAVYIKVIFIPEHEFVIRQYFLPVVNIGLLFFGYFIFPEPAIMDYFRYWLLAVGWWLLAVGCWLLAVGCWLLAVGCWLFYYA